MEISQIKKKNFCLAPWFGLTISGNGGMRPCCEHEFIYNIHHDPPPVDFYNQREFIGLRKDFLEGKKPSGCQRCWKHEDQVGFSRRIDFNKNFIEYVPEGYVFKELLKEPQWLQVDISLSNVCNLKCRMCGIWGSVGWLDDEKVLEHINRNYRREWRPKYLKLMQNDLGEINFLFKGLKKIKLMEFKGGEPFLDVQHTKILEYLINNNLSQNLTLHYTTNGTVINDYILRLLSYFKKVHIVISVEGLGELYKYIRGGEYSFETDVVKNIQRFSCMDNVSISFASAIQAYNILYLADLYKFLNNLGIKRASAEGAFGSVVHSPPYLSPFVLPIELRYLASKRLKDINDFNFLSKKLIQIRENEDNKLFTIFKNFTNDLDKARNENVLDVIPEFKSYW